MKTVFNRNKLAVVADGGEAGGQLVKDEYFTKEKEAELGDPSVAKLMQALQRKSVFQH